LGLFQPDDGPGEWPPETEGANMKALRQVVCSLFAAASFLDSPVSATSFSTDQSDLYFIPSESGWGMQLVQRGSVIFATLFVYDPANPTWYTATMDFTSNSTWTGVLYATTGTDFRVPWNPANLTVTPVGTMTWTSTSVANGTLTYVVNGVTVVKNVTRQTLVLDDFSGLFGGVIQQTVTGCTNTALNGPATLAGGWLISQSADAVSMQTDFQEVISETAPEIACTYAGTLSQAGQMGALGPVPFTCSDGSMGSISLSRLQVTPYAISGSFVASYSNPQGCQSSGGFGGGKGATF